MDEAKAALYGLIVGMLISAILCSASCEHSVLKQKCAETQGKYDFCVQKVNWEVKK